MKKRLFAMVLVICALFIMQPVTSLAACVFERPEGTTEIWGTSTRVYTVGEPFRAWEVGLNIYNKQRIAVYYADHLEFWADGNPISEGYKFKEVGQKTIVVKRYDKQNSYGLQVIPVLNGKLKSCSVITQPAKNTYRQRVEGFEPKDIVVQCTFTDGTTQNLGYKDLEFYAGTRNMKSYRDGQAIKEGYRFKEAGEKDLIIRVCSNEMRIPFVVTPFFNKEVSKVEMVQESAALNYRVGEAFRVGDYTAQCFYTDGSTETVDGKALSITANGTRIYDGYKFQVAGKKDVVVSLGDYETTYTMDVSQ